MSTDRNTLSLRRQTIRMLTIGELRLANGGATNPGPTRTTNDTVTGTRRPSRTCPTAQTR